MKKGDSALDPGSTTTIRLISVSPDKMKEVCRVIGGYVEVFHLIGGEMDVEYDGGVYSLHAGDTVIGNAFTPICFHYRSNCKLYNFVFDSPRFFDEIGIPALCRFQTYIRGDKLLAELCGRVNDEYENQTAFHERMLTSLTTQLVIHLYRHYSKPLPPLTPQLMGRQRIVRAAQAYIYENCQKGISTRDIGAHIGVSTAYLCRCFREALNVTPLEYAERIRCRKAHEDLSRGVSTVADIAAKYCYSSTSYFSRRYQKFYDCTPAETLADAIERRALVGRNSEQDEREQQETE